MISNSLGVSSIAVPDRSQCSQDLHGRGAPIQRIEMNAGSAALQQLDALRGGMGDTELHDSLGIFTTSIKLGGETEGQGSAAHQSEPLDLRGIGDRHDAGDDRYT